MKTSDLCDAMRTGLCELKIKEPDREHRLYFLSFFKLSEMTC